MTVLILGAAGLIGNFIAGDLIRQRLPIIAVACRFNRAQRVQLDARLLRNSIGAR